MNDEPGDAPFDGSGLSIVVPFFEEGPLVDAVLSKLRRELPRAEVIAIDDGSRDDTWGLICAAPGVWGLRFPENQGQSAAIYWGLRSATQPLVGIMDGDGQNDPAGFKGLVHAVRAGNANVACGYRARRRDSCSRRAGANMAEIEVNRRPRMAGTAKYGKWRRACAGIGDLVGVAWLLDRKLLPPTMEIKE